MARLRKFTAYRRLERPYTRFSKFRRLSYVRARPVDRVVRHNMGDPNKAYDHTLYLVAKDGVQVRDNAIEAARKTMNHILERQAGKKQFDLQIRMFAHHVLRENPLASGAGADRMSTGMKHSFGKPIGRACQVKKGKILLSLRVFKQHLELGKKALKRATHKLPCRSQIIIQ
ncbi:50S ribosomal protein L16 [Candidatus Woesearchaeota archaeon]|nr:50S ribosomal protein L16 [Candidatus Woesearchaeota archaeon]